MCPTCFLTLCCQKWMSRTVNLHRNTWQHDTATTLTTWLKMNMYKNQVTTFTQTDGVKMYFYVIFQFFLCSDTKLSE